MTKTSTKKVTTKECPKCGSTSLALVRTHNFKYCANCNLKIPWYLEEGQKPLH